MLSKLNSMLLLLFSTLVLLRASTAFSVSKETTLYGVPGSGWRSWVWNWGSAVGTGHDCAAICRRRYATRKARAELIHNLLEPAESREPEDFEEVKLILGLAWQNGRWDGRDGGPGGYGDVLALMAEAERYEVGTEQECTLRLVQDMQSRFALLEPDAEDEAAMNSLLDGSESDLDLARRRCSGLVLQAMGFVESGL